MVLTCVYLNRVERFVPIFRNAAQETEIIENDVMTKTKDPVNQSLVDLMHQSGVSKFGIMNNAVWHDDPRRLVFTLSRYKFVSKILSGYDQVVEIGCGDGFCARVVKQEVQNLHVTDFDPLFIEGFREISCEKWPITAAVHDIMKAPLPSRYDAAYSLDVLEHIDPNSESVFLENVARSLTKDGVGIIGMPSLESQRFASEASKAGHVNCKSGTDLKRTLQKYFKSVFMFSMNDEVVHTGFFPMAHYLMGVCVGPK